MVKNLQASFASGSFNGIGGIGNVLEFTENKLGDEEWTLNKTGFRDVSNAAIDDDAGI
jgi:hypothetical protein